MTQSNTTPHGKTSRTERLRWFKYVKPYMGWFIIGPLLMIVEVIGEVLLPKLLAYIIDFGVKHEVEEMPAWLQCIYNCE